MYCTNCLTKIDNDDYEGMCGYCYFGSCEIKRRRCYICNFDHYMCYHWPEDGFEPKYELLDKADQYKLSV